MARAVMNSACRSRWITWVDASTLAQAQSRADELLHPRVHGCIGADGAVDRAHGDDLAGATEPVAVAIQLEGPDGELVPEARGLGDDAVRPAGHHGVAMVQRESLGRAEQTLELHEQHVGGGAKLQREAGVDDVGRREPEVHPAPRRPDRGGHDVDEGGDVVAGHGLALRHGLDRERCALTTGRGVLLRDHAELREGFHREKFDLEPVREA